ncbi:unnamed protein product [Rhizoctonia solani]|uniref:Ricin B lectin domain-containing protein n=1 Tax=Rhizoctonia solani TaxID=456999 RepID=A0A8H3D187_9AGAM|nr:unnamed protein product [Rhizoctonia solani]
MATFPHVYRIKNVGSGHYLALTTATPKDPIACLPTQPDDKKGLWRIVSLPNGAYRIKNEENGLEVDRPTNSLRISSNSDGSGYAFYLSGPDTARKIRATATGGTVLQHEKANTQVVSARDNASEKQQQWIFETAKWNVKTGSVIDLEKCIPGDNVKIFGYGANGGENQKWDIQPSGTSPHMTLRCLATNKYATFSDFNAGTSLRSSGQPQECLIIPANRGFYISPVPGPGYVYDLTNGNAADETLITPVINHGLDHQKWHFIAV